MNLILLKKYQKTVELDINKYRHLNCKIGDSLKVGVINSKVGSAEVIGLSETSMTLSVSLSEEPPVKSPLTLIICMMRPKMLKRMLRSISMFGIKEVHLINSTHVDKSYWQTDLLENKKYEEYFMQGLEQSKDTLMPSLITHKLFKPFVEDKLPQLIKNKKAIVAHPYAQASAGQVQADMLIIGPERGFTDYEVKKLQQAGALAMSFSNRVLRTEDFLSYALGKLS